MNTPTNLNSVVLPSSEADVAAIQKILKEVSDCMTRIEGEKEYIKDALGDLSKQYGIPKVMLNKVARAFHKRNIEEEKAKSDDMFYLYDGIFSLINKKE